MSESDERLETVADKIDDAKRQAALLADEDVIDPDPVEGLAPDAATPVGGAPADDDSPTSDDSPTQG